MSKKDFFGRFVVESFFNNADGTVGCVMIGKDDKSLKLTLGHVNPVEMEKTVHVDAWMVGKKMELELVKQDGSRTKYGVSPFPKA